MLVTDKIVCSSVLSTTVSSLRETDSVDMYVLGTDFILEARFKAVRMVDNGPAGFKAV